jgi:uncharacterized coiled-coil protein SlyX
MEQSGRIGMCQMIEARIGEWEKTITNIGHRMAKAKDDPELKEKVEQMKAKLPKLGEKLKAVMAVPDDKWSEFKSEVDLMFENLYWLQKFVMRKLGGG